MLPREDAGQVAVVPALPSAITILLPSLAKSPPAPKPRRKCSYDTQALQVRRPPECSFSD